MTKTDFVDYYQLLGIEMDANPDEIKAAYDARLQELEEKFNVEALDAKQAKQRQQQLDLLNWALQLLMNPQNRHQYDEKLHQWNIAKKI